MKAPDFFSGLVFGFDVGTGSIGYAVRRGDKFLDVGVLICDSEGSDLSKRRDLRRQRRTLRSRRFRRQWFAAELEKIGLTRPQSAAHDPITLRLRALNREKLSPEELHTALTHLFKRRGYSKVPWANKEARAKRPDDDEGEIKAQVAEIKNTLNGLHPCQFLSKRREEMGKSPMEHWARKIYWPREVLRDEFFAIAEAQKAHYPKLAAAAGWLLYGDTKEVEGFHVFFKASEARNPGVLGLRWPRFDNRGPALDSLNPVDDLGRPLHVVRKNKEAFAKAQWELALMNFRVLDAATRQKVDPRMYFPVFIENLRNEWNKKGKVTVVRLQKLASPFADKFLLIDGQKPLAPETGAGRARYSSPTLNKILKEISAGRRVDPPQPILRRKGETAERALNRYLAEIKHPVVRHRLILFRRLLAELVARFGQQPDVIVLEAVRTLAMNKKSQRYKDLMKRAEENRKEREQAREELTSSNQSRSRNAVLRYRLWKEAQSTCPFCGDKITQEQLFRGDADIEHLVPRCLVDCNELYNLTVGHIHCNRVLKGERTPYAAFATTEKWEQLKVNAQKCFSGRKLEIFLNPDAERLVEEKADLQHTAYIARVIRHVSLIHLGWLNDEGKDPTIEAGNKPATSFQVTNGQLTSRLRQAWGLNQILHPLPPGKRWDEISEDEQKQFSEKNRGDFRHHALDAMVICCTLPWLAHRTHGATDEFGNHGWWTQDEKQRSKAANPIFPHDGQMYAVVKKEVERIGVRHHVSRSNHQQTYATTVYGKISKDTYAAREKVSDLKPADFTDIFPKELGVYFSAAWDHYKSEFPDWEQQLKKTKDRLPDSFARRLCFSHFQRWRADGAPIFAWPEKIKIPIRSVKLVAPVSDTTVVPFAKGTPGFVKRTTFKEVRIHRSEDGKDFVPVFVPYWDRDNPIFEKPIDLREKPVAVIRKGMIVTTKKAFSSGAQAGKYRVIEIGQGQAKLLPPHVANKEDAVVSFGIKKSGIKPYWSDFIRALGYELPHPPFAQSQSARSAEA